MPTSDPDLHAYMREMHHAEERGDIAAFSRTMGKTFELVRFQERPDAVCHQPDGSLIGVRADESAELARGKGSSVRHDRIWAHQSLTASPIVTS